MDLAKRITIYVAVGVIVLALGGVTGWYLLLRSKTQSISATDAARGLTSDVPAFNGTLGSTVVNSQNSIQGGFSTSSSATQTASATRLWQVDQAPVAGAAFVPSGSAASSTTPTTLYFVERGNGYVFSADAQAQKTTRLTNTLSPKTYEALFVPGYPTVILRSLNAQGALISTYASFAASSTISSAPIALTSQNLPNNIRRIAVDPAGASIFALSGSAYTGGAVGTTIAVPNLKQKQVFTSSIGSWEPQFSPQGIILTESPADGIAGYAYVLKSSGALSLLFGPLPGLEVLPHPSENVFLYSSSANGGLSLYAKVGKSAAILLPVHTVAEKCVWAPGQSLVAYCAVPSAISSSNFLDDWYQGLVHTSDVWWQIDASAGTAQQLAVPPRALDVQHPTIDDSGNYIVFENASNQSLWMLKVVQ